MLPIIIELEDERNLKHDSFYKVAGHKQSLVNKEM